ncbi:MAG TPA: chromate resistance protein ChrB domain-containing protein [Bryobacteraceae bacterium]|nr:chromate resistance protein ChrB domain-containing protein [Bryobacteraceae bacterium]
MSQLRLSNWLLLLHQIPPSPPYFRAKVLRQLNQLGALPIKNSAYLLPETDENREDFEWLRFEVSEQGGEAWLFRSEAIAGFTRESLEASFRALRETDYKQLLDQSREFLGREGDRPESEWRRIKRRFDEVRRIDFFNAPGREELETIMEKIETVLQGSARQPAAKPGLADLKGRTWVTRRGVKVDRISSAWLIRRFIDPEARLLFVDQDRYAHQPGEVRFDMFEGEFTHEGDLCTFEVLLHHAKLNNRALDAIAEIVHDIDLKDNKYQRPETSGIAAMISGLTGLNTGDEQRIEEGARLFEAVYAGLR